VLIVSHNRDFLDPVVTKTLEFRPGQPPQLFAGNITYYLEKTAAERSTAKSNAPGKSPAAATAATAGGSPATSRKEQRRREAEAREIRSKVLKPLEAEFETLETKISEMEAALGTLTENLSSPDLAADPDKFRQTTNAVANLTTALEKAYTRWAALSEEIDRTRAKLDG